MLKGSRSRAANQSRRPRPLVWRHLLHKFAPTAVAQILQVPRVLADFARDAQVDIKISPGGGLPKRGDFVAWSALISEWAAPGERCKDIRQHLKTLAASTRQLVKWLAHASRDSQRTAGWRGPAPLPAA